MDKMAIPEAVILDTQKRVYDIKEEISIVQDAVTRAEAIYRKQEENLKYAKKRLVETVAFLQAYSPDTVKGTWWEELGISEAYGLERACYECCHSGGSAEMNEKCEIFKLFGSVAAMVIDTQDHQEGATYDCCYADLVNALAPIIGKACHDFKIHDER